MVEHLGVPLVSHQDSYNAAVDAIGHSPLAQRHHREEALILDAGRQYEELGGRGELAGIQPPGYTPLYVSDEELRRLYERLRDGAFARMYYDRLVGHASEDRCPYCSDREPTTLDHYLAKSEFSAYAVLPVNLVPSCDRCNTKKGNFEQSTRGHHGAVLHPYFDDVSDEHWLKATIVDNGGPVARFYVDQSAISDPVLRTRASSHLNALRLKKYFKVKAGQELNNLERKLPAVLIKRGRSAVVDHLLDQADFRAGERVNCWERAVYEALAVSAWYLDVYLPTVPIRIHTPTHGGTPIGN